MALHFVETSILTSDNGIDFGTETQLENEETRKARLASEQAANKPLYMQLAERKEKQQEEYDLMTKKIFGGYNKIDF